MRLIISIVILAFAGPAAAGEKPLLQTDCMAVIGPAAYGKQTFGTGIISGIVIGYAIAHGHSAEDAKKIGQKMGEICRQNPGFTFGDALHTFDRD